MQQQISPLSTEELKDLSAKRRWVIEHYEKDSEHLYDTVGGKLTLIQTIIANGWIAPDETLKLQCLGVSFGDALAQELGLTLQSVTDEYGTDPMLVDLGTSIKLFPVTSISKRIEQGQDVDVQNLFNAACSSVSKLRAEGV